MGTNNPDSKWESLNHKSRLAAAISSLREGMGKYEEHYPNWREEYLHATLYDLATKVRHHLRDDGFRKTCALELRYDVDFNWSGWDAWKQGTGKGPLTVSGRFTKDMLFDKEHLPDVLTKATNEHLTQVFLAGITNHVIVAMSGKGDDSSRPWMVYLPDTLDEQARQMESAERDQFVHPSSWQFISAGVLDGENASNIRHNHGKNFTGVAGSVPYKGTLFVQVFPLHVDEEQRQAYYPMLVNLFLWKEGDFWQNSLNLEGWTEEELNYLDDALSAIFLSSMKRDKPIMVELNATDEGVKVTALVQSPLPEPAKSRRLILDAPTRIDREVYNLVSATRRLSLPRKWDSIQSWDALVEQEKARLLDNFGEARAIRERYLVRKVTHGKPTLELTTETEDELMDAKATTWLRRVYKEAGIPREYIVRRLHIASGYVEARLSWFGMAWPLVAEGMKVQEKQLRTLKNDLRQRPLFEDLDRDLRETVNDRLRFMGHVRDGHEVMRLILHELGRQGTNPVRIPAFHLRSLLECETDIHGHERVRGCLEALREVSFSLTVHTSDIRQDAAGHFLAQVAYEGRGPGRHTDGDWWLQVGDAYLGCLKVFAVPGHKLRDTREVIEYDFGKKLTKEEASKLNYIRGWSTAPWFDKAKGFTSEQATLRTWLENNLTTNADTARKDRQQSKVKKADAAAHELREYRSDFCPLIPEGTAFYGALGHTKSRHAEGGWKLVQAPSKPSKTGGGKYEGLMSVLGYEYPPGSAYRRRENNVRQVLQDLKAVVGDAYQGLVVARFGRQGEWVTLDEAIKRWPVDDLAKKALWFFFIATNYRELVKDAIESHHAERHARGETPYELEVTQDQDRFEQALDERGRTIPKDDDTEEGDTSSQYLRAKLKVARLERNLRQSDVAAYFGVTQPALAFWESGAKPIPAELVPLVERWADTGQVPTEAELAARKTRRSGLDWTTKAGGRGRKKPSV